MLDLEKNINKGFSKIAVKYEALDKTSSLIQWMRKRVRSNLQKNLNPNDSIIEINCGSGIDAVFLVENGYKVHATDVADGMINELKSKIVLDENLTNNLTFEQLSYKDLHEIKNKSFNSLFSNFGGLNCCSLIELEKVINSFDGILTENGKITLVIMPKICLWEFLKIFKGNKNALRRLKKNGVFANVEGEKIQTFYHSKKQVKNLLVSNFENIKVENICFFGPTGNRVDYPKKYPFLFKIWTLLDRISNKISFLQGFGDYYIVTAQKKN